MDSDRPKHMAHLFASNILPQPIEIPSIEHAIEESTNAIEQLQHRLQKLEHRRQGYRSLLSTVRRLPPEVLGEIFSSFLDIVKRRKELSEERRQESLCVPLINLCLVCRTWRDAAFSTPKLWTYFEISTPKLWMPEDIKICTEPSMLLLEKASRWFDRCKGIPNKTLSVYHEDRSYWSPRDCVKGGCLVADPDLARLLTQGPSFENLVIECRDLQCFRALISLMDSLKSEKIRPWDSIKSLDLYFHQDWDEVDPSSSIFRHIPPVTSFALHLPDRYCLAAEFDHLLHLQPLEPILTNLTTFTFLCDWDGTMILEVLQLCVNVEVLTLDLKNSSVTHRRIPLPTSQLFQDGPLLPNVRVLRLRHMQHAAPFIRLFKTPVLVELDISFADYENLEEPANVNDVMEASETLPLDIVGFAIRSRCNERVRKLRLDSVSLKKGPSIIKNILIRLPSLTHLALDQVHFDPSLFDVFSDDKNGFIPRVEVLELLRLAPDFPLHHLEDFVRRRRKPGSPPGSLKKLVTTFRPYEPPDFDDYQSFKEIVHVNMIERSFASGFA